MGGKGEIDEKEEGKEQGKEREKERKIRNKIRSIKGGAGPWCLSGNSGLYLGIPRGTKREKQRDKKGDGAPV